MELRRPQNLYHPLLTSQDVNGFDPHRGHSWNLGALKIHGVFCLQVKLSVNPTPPRTTLRRHPPRVLTYTTNSDPLAEAPRKLTIVETAGFDPLAEAPRKLGKPPDSATLASVELPRGGQFCQLPWRWASV